MKVKSSFVCSQENSVSRFQNRDQIIAAIESFKTKHQAALLTVQYLSYIYTMIDVRN